MQVERQINHLKVKLTIELLVENSGIGGYEYWGITGYDKGEDYFMIDAISWDKTLYSPEENKMIDSYTRNAEFREEMIEQAEKEYKL